MITKRLSGAGLVLAFLLFPSLALAEETCDFGAPHPDAPEEIHQFDFLIGNHRIEARQWTGEAFSDGYLEAEWNGRWGIDGHAVIDEWFGPQFSPETPRGFGVNVRYYDEEEGRWSMVWQATTGAAYVLEARQGEDGVLRMWRTYPEQTQERFTYFEIYDEGHWARIDGQVLEDGTHQNQIRLDAYEVPCEG